MENIANWSNLTWQEKREVRFNKWLNPPGVKFVNKDAEKQYKTRVTRFIKAIKLEEPDRVPVMLPAQYFPAVYAGSNLKKAMNDYAELERAWLKYLREFEMDSFIPPSLVFPGKVLEILGYKIQKWPGHGLADDAPSHQFVEGEYMKADEYDAFIRDPADYLQRVFLPRSNDALKGFSRLAPITPMIGIPVSYVASFGDPEVRASYQKLLEAGQEAMKWLAVVGRISDEALSTGYPNIWGGMSGAPFDMIGDWLRGTHGIMMDMFKQPAKLHEAMEKIVPIAVSEVTGSADVLDCPVIFMPLHKGTGGFMSNKQFEEFYWPTFKKVMSGLINEGLVPMPFAEGDYEPRLDIIKDMPDSSVVWFFEKMDMVKARKVLGGKACIAGNVPVTVMTTGTPEEVKKRCRDLIKACAPGGGYILTASAFIDEGNPENLRAMMEAAKEFGVYK
jgi:uroporphyrinogen-III decarboxylase